MDRARTALARLFACVALGLGAGACALLTHASDYQIAEAPPGLCAACPESDSALRHPPCAGGAAAGAEGSFVYAARRFYFGHAGSFQGAAAASFELGFDVDCSSRPDGGRPVLCEPESDVGWERLPRGIDNAWLQRILAPLEEAAEASGRPFDLDALVSDNHERGLVGLLVTVDAWNGKPDDPDVRVGLYSSPGVDPSLGAPLWDGDDVWNRFAEGGAVDERYFEIAHAKGYVSGGVLVVDHRSKGNVDLRLSTTRGTFRLTANDLFFVASITPERIGRFTLSALADLRSAYESVPSVIDLVAPCDGVARDFLEAHLGAMVLEAGDMPSDRARAADEPCNAISLAFAFDAEPARVSGFAERAPVPAPDCR